MKPWLIRALVFLVGLLTGAFVVFCIRFLEDVVPHGGAF